MKKKKMPKTDNIKRNGERGKASVKSTVHLVSLELALQVKQGGRNRTPNGH